MYLLCTEARPQGNDLNVSKLQRFEHTYFYIMGPYWYELHPVKQ